MSQVFHMKDLGALHYFLGIQVTHNNHALILSQTRCLLSLLKKFGLDGVKPISTPLASNIQLFATDGVPLTDPTFYQKMVGSPQYLTLTRPDIPYDVHFVCQFMQAPCEPHLVVVKRIFQFLKAHSIVVFTLSKFQSLLLLASVMWTGWVPGMIAVQLPVLQSLWVIIYYHGVQRSKLQPPDQRLKLNIKL